MIVNLILQQEIYKYPLAFNLNLPLPNMKLLISFTFHLK